MKTKILFLIHDLGQGGAEKVLVSLVNHMNKSQFDITVISLFGGGVNEKYLNDDICYSCVYKRMIPANSKWMKLFTPVQLHKKYIKEKYDIEVSFLEGPCARIVSGCPDPDTKLISWIHVEQHTLKIASSSFRSESEAKRCYSKFDKIICVSKTVKDDFCGIFGYEDKTKVLYNVIESDKIKQLSQEKVDGLKDEGILRLIAVGTLKESKGYWRLLRVVKRLIDTNHLIHLYILGDGPLREKMIQFIAKNGMQNNVDLLGYQANPYRYVKNCDLFVCASFSEGFSTAASEALILGVPICTVEVSGMKELLGNNNEYGIITENNESSLYEGIKKFIENPELIQYYKKQVTLRANSFDIKELEESVQKMLICSLNQ